MRSYILFSVWLDQATFWRDVYPKITDRATIMRAWFETSFAAIILTSIIRLFASLLLNIDLEGGAILRNLAIVLIVFGALLLARRPHYAVVFGSTVGLVAAVILGCLPPLNSSYVYANLTHLIAFILHGFVLGFAIGLTISLIVPEKREAWHQIVQRMTAPLIFASIFVLVIAQFTSIEFINVLSGWIWRYTAQITAVGAGILLALAHLKHKNIPNSKAPM